MTVTTSGKPGENSSESSRIARAVSGAAPIGLAACVAVGIGVSVQTSVALILLCLGLGAVACTATAAVAIPTKLKRRVTRAACAYLVYYFGIGLLMSKLVQQSDSLGYYRTALYLAGDPGGAIVMATHGSGREGYLWTLAALFKVGHPSFLVPIAFSAATLALTYVVMVRCVWEGFGDGPAGYVTTIFGLAPPLLIWGTQGLRESSVYLLLALIVALIVSFARRPAFVKGAGLVGSTSCLLVFRGGLVPVVLVGVIAGLTIGSRRLVQRPQHVVLIAAVACGAVVVFYFYGGTSNLVSSYFEIDRVDQVRRSLGSAGSGFTQEGVTPWQVVKGVVRTCLGPFPWEWATLPRAIPGAVFCWWASFMAVRAVTSSRDIARRLAPSMVLALCVLLSVAIGATNYGTLVRLRFMGFLLLIPAICVSLYRGRQRRRDVSGATPRTGHERQVSEGSGS